MNKKLMTRGIVQFALVGVAAVSIFILHWNVLFWITVAALIGIAAFWKA